MTNHHFTKIDNFMVMYILIDQYDLNGGVFMLQYIDSTNGIIQISLATNEETEEIITLLKHVTEWLKANGIDQWDFSESSGNDEEIKQSIQNQDTYSVKKDGEIIATFTLTQKQSPWDKWLWGDKHDHAVYLHKFALAQSGIGSGLRMELLQWIEYDSKQKGFNTVRLDCIENNKKLNLFYARCGYEKQGKRYGFSLYQKTI